MECMLLIVIYLHEKIAQENDTILGSHTSNFCCTCLSRQTKCNLHYTCSPNFEANCYRSV